MPNLKKEFADLKAKNKKLKALLKNAVQLLHQSKEIIQHSAKPAKTVPKKTATKRTKISRSHACAQA